LMALLAQNPAEGMSVHELLASNDSAQLAWGGGNGSQERTRRVCSVKETENRDSTLKHHSLLNRNIAVRHWKLVFECTVPVLSLDVSPVSCDS
jgi:hypothetical protein